MMERCWKVGRWVVKGGRIVGLGVLWGVLVIQKVVVGKWDSGRDYSLCR